MPESGTSCTASLALPKAEGRRYVIILQTVTTVWMLVECAVSLIAAKASHSSTLLAFGSDSLVELLSAVAVLLQFLPKTPLSPEKAGRFSGWLLIALALIVGITATLKLMHGSPTETSATGIFVTAAALVIMPVLAWHKRKYARLTHDRALSADAVQSLTCSLLAAITLASLAINAVFHLPWIDSAGAFTLLPLLFIEAQRALKGESCC